jgi:hypothetical protein
VALMTSRIISEPEFAARIRALLSGDWAMVGSVTGPGRSGAVASVYASHILRVPWFGMGGTPPVHLGSILLIDTAEQTGATLRKAEARLRRAGATHIVVAAVYHEPPRVRFWYEAPEPQRYKHERITP